MLKDVLLPMVLGVVVGSIIMMAVFLSTADDSNASEWGTCTSTGALPDITYEKAVFHADVSGRADLAEMFTRSYDTMRGNDDYTVHDIKARPDKQDARWQGAGPNDLWQSIYAELDSLEACRDALAEAMVEAEASDAPPPLDMPPVITLTGSLVTMQLGQPYMEPGFECTDDMTAMPSVIVDVPDMSAPGTYSITYTCIDSAMQQDVERRTVIIEAPVRSTTAINPVQYTVNYANGTSHVITLTETDSSTYVITWTDGDGVMMSQTFESLERDITSMSALYDNGNRSALVLYEDGQKYWQKSWYENGYTDLEVRWWPQSEFRQYETKHREINGMLAYHLAWYENGQLWFNHTYTTDGKILRVLAFSSDGAAIQDNSYVYLFASDGTLQSVTIFHSGVKRSSEHYNMGLTDYVKWFYPSGSTERHLIHWPNQDNNIKSDTYYWENGQIYKQQIFNMHGIPTSQSCWNMQGVPIDAC